MWKDLSMSEKNRIIEMAVSQGVIDLNTISSLYDQQNMEFGNTNNQMLDNRVRPLVAAKGGHLFSGDPEETTEIVSKDKSRDTETAQSYRNMSEEFSFNPYILGFDLSRHPNAFTDQRDYGRPYWSLGVNIPVSKSERIGDPNNPYDDNYGSINFNSGNAYNNGLSWNFSAGLEKGNSVQNDARYINGTIEYEHPKSGLFGQLAASYTSTENPIKKDVKDFYINGKLGWKRTLGRQQDRELAEKKARIEAMRTNDVLENLQRQQEEFEANKDAWWEERLKMRESEPVYKNGGKLLSKKSKKIY